MTILTPQGELYLLKDVPLDSEYQHTIDFDNAETQQQYFMNKIADIFSDEDKSKGYKFIRDNQTINVYSKIEELFGCNYLMYKNNKKWYYAFITRKDYVSPDVTRLSIKLDVMQSFMFDYQLGESFIAREHQDRWRGTSTTLYPVFNKQPEDLELGKNYVTKKEKLFANERYDANYKSEWVVVKCSRPLDIKRQDAFGNYDTLKDNLPATKVDDIPTGIYIYLFPINTSVNNTNNRYLKSSFGVAEYVFGSEHLLRHLTTDPNIISMQIFPQCPIAYDFDENGYVYFLNSSTCGMLVENVQQYAGSSIVFNTTNYTIARLINVYSSELGMSIPIIEENITRPNIELSPNVKYESKLLTSPFAKILIEYNNQSQEFEIENAEYTSYHFYFKIRQSIMNTNNILVTPQSYLGQEDNKNNKFEVIAQNEFYLSNDYWKQYEANNKVSMNGNLILAGVQSAVNIGLGIATGGVGLAFAGGQAVSVGGQVINELMKREDIKNQPNTPKVAGQDLVSSKYVGKFGIIVRMLVADNEFLQNAFKYFMHYGYACRCFKKPNTKSRYYYNFIKTIGANIQTDIDNEYREEIKSIYDNGVTIWHYREASTFKGVQNYDFENAEMSLI